MTKSVGQREVILKPRNSMPNLEELIQQDYKQLRHFSLDTRVLCKLNIKFRVFGEKYTPYKTKGIT